MCFHPQNILNKVSFLYIAIEYIKKRFDHALSKESWPSLNLEKKKNMSIQQRMQIKNVKNGIRTHALSDQYLKLAP